MVTNTQNSELLAFFKALANANRLKIIGLLANQPSMVEKLASQLGLSEATVSHHLNHLAEIGLVSARAEGYYNIYSLQKDTLEGMAKKMLIRDALPLLAIDVDIAAYDRKVINEFTNLDGSIKVLPAQRKKMDVILGYIVKVFDLGKNYSEKEVN